MSSRRLLISACVVSLLASPALPQNSGVPPTGTQPPSRLQADARAAQPPANMRQALRAWGLNRPSPDMSFQRGDVTSERAEFTAIVLKNDDGSNATLDTLVVTRSNLPGPTYGQFTITAEKYDDGDGTRMGRLSMVGVRGWGNLLEAFKAADEVAKRQSRAPNGPTRAAPAVVDMVSISDLATTIDDSSETVTVRIGQFDVTNVVFDKQLRNFGTVSMKDAVFESASASVKLANLELSGVQAEQLTAWGAPEGPSSPKLDLLSLALGHLSLNEISYTSKTTNGQTPTLSTLTINRFSIDNIKDGFIGQLTIAGVKLGGGVGAKAFEASLNRFAIGGLNMRYFSEFGAAMTASLARNTFKVPGSTDTPPVVSSTVLPAALPASSNPAAAPAAAPRPAILIKDLMKGGPLDGGMRSFDMADFTASGAGFGFSMDRIGLTQERNSDDIVTRTEFLPTTLRFSWPTDASGKSGAMAGILAGFGRDHIAMRFSGAATFAPLTDKVSVENYETEIVDWGKIRMDFAMSGINKLMSEVTMDELYAATLPPSQAEPGATARQQMSKVLNLYRGVTIDAGRFEITDLGGIDNAARMSIAVGPRRAPSNEPATPAQKRAVRDGWAASLRNVSGDKNKPALERQFSLGLARWLEAGGSLVFEANPPTPIAFSALENAATITPATWGLKVSNRPAGAAAAR